MIPKHIILTTLLGLLSCTGVHAHSWIEQLNVISPNGTMIEPAGFPRGNVRRGMPGFGDDAMVWLIPPNSNKINQIDASQMMCRPEQRSQTQPGSSPRLQAVPGAAVALRYQENGHVTIPDTQPGKPTNRGTNFVYYTDKSAAEDKFLQIHRVWNADGSGGDRRGRLIATQPYDDGQCYQQNDHSISVERQQKFKKTADQLQGVNLWCQTDVQIPADAKPGTTITLYWVWDWPTAPGTGDFKDGKQEIYTTCMDIDVVEPSTLNSKVAIVGKPSFVQQDVGNAAVPAQFNDISNPMAVVKPVLIPFGGVVAAAGDPSGVSASTSIALSPSGSSKTPTTATPGLASTTSAASTTAVATTSQPLSPDTVTLTVTVTQQPSTTTTKASIAVVTQYETIEMITMTISNTLDQQASSSSVPPSQPPNSKTEAIYRLRARAPFYPYINQISTSSFPSSLQSATPTRQGC